MARNPYVNQWPPDWTNNPSASMIHYNMYSQHHYISPIVTVASASATSEPLTAGVKRPHEHISEAAPNNPIPSGQVANRKDHHVLWTRAYDKPIPDPIRIKCKPLYCEICCVNLNSVIQAKMHYEGKSHEKRVKNLLLIWAKENNTVPPKKAARLANENNTAITHQHDPRQELYCGPCDTSFTSNAHAQQHFSGRNHQRIMNGLSPLKAGYFNTRTGKWQRQPPPVPESDQGAESSTPTPPALPPPPPPPPPSQEADGPKYFCDVCGINATSQAQLQMHLSGRNHKIKCAKTTFHGGNPPVFEPFSNPSPIKHENECKKAKKDYSIYRTPSGHFYCGLCNLSVNSENQFVQHMASRKHKLKESSAKGKKPKTNKK